MRHLRYSGPLVIMLVLWLTACGSTATTAASNNVTPAVRSSPSATALTNGCATQNIPIDPLPPAQVIAMQQSGGNAMPISLAVGESLEVHLSAAISWRLTLADPAQILSASALEGWYNRALPACIWRYRATKAGSATFTFTGTVLCQPGQTCPQLVIESDFDVTVK